MSRRPAVAGTFYNGDPDLLPRDIERCFLNNRGPLRVPVAHFHQERKGNVLGLLAPHAGYVYSGPAAAHAYSALASDGVPDVAVILGPNHHGVGEIIAVASANNWVTPIGVAHIDTEVASAILSASKYAREDDEAHRKEHSIEVQVPFLQFVGGHKIKIVPICLAHLAYPDAVEVAHDLGNAIAEAVKGKNAIVIASSDMTHYEPQNVVEQKDALAIEKIENLDAEGLLATVEENDISMCGVVGAAVTIIATKALGATKGRKLAYYTSGDVTGDHRQVVGYLAASFEK